MQQEPKRRHRIAPSIVDILEQWAGFPSFRVGNDPVRATSRPIRDVLIAGMGGNRVITTGCDIDTTGKPSLVSEPRIGQVLSRSIISEQLLEHRFCSAVCDNRLKGTVNFNGPATPPGMHAIFSDARPIDPPIRCRNGVRPAQPKKKLIRAVFVLVILNVRAAIAPFLSPHQYDHGTGEMFGGMAGLVEEFQ